MRRSSRVAALCCVLLLAACGQSRSEPPTLDALVETQLSTPDRFSVPSKAEREGVARAVQDLERDDRDRLVPNGFEVRTATDGSGREVEALIESAPRNQGAGLYAVRRTSSHVLVQVPHPRADAHTEDLGLALFDATSARALLVAGALRTAGGGAADVAHRPSTTFAAVSDRIVRKGDQVLQVHGFSDDKHPRYGDVVLSDGQGKPAPAITGLGESLRRAGFEVCVYDGRQCQSLGATTNEQAPGVRRAGATFIHMEVSRGVRDSSSRTADLVSAVSRALAP